MMWSIRVSTVDSPRHTTIAWRRAGPAGPDDASEHFLLRRSGAWGQWPWRLRMDAAKCRALKRDLAAQPQPPLVAIERFFDGNDDLGSIGCNLMPHPGVEAFRDVLTGLLCRPD